MAIDWKNVKPVMISLFNTLSGGLQTVWVDKRRPFIDPKEQAIVLLRPRTGSTIGVDDRRYTDLAVAAPAATLEETANGHRRCSFDVRVESFRHDDDRFSFNAASKIRTGLGFRSSLDILRAVNIALVRAGDVLDVAGVVQDSRSTSVAVLDLILTVGICSADTENPVFNIETVDNPFDNVNTVISPPC